jgi:hypothetical protein
MISAVVPDKWAIHPSPGHRTSWANNGIPKGTQRFLDSLVHYTPLGDHHPCLGEQDRIDTWKVTATARDVQTTELTYEIWKDIGKLSLKKRTTQHPGVADCKFVIVYGPITICIRLPTLGIRKG